MLFAHFAIFDFKVFLQRQAYPKTGWRNWGAT